MATHLRHRKADSMVEVVSSKVFSTIGQQEVSSSSPPVGIQHSSHKLLSYDEIPEWHQDNEFIRYGYRPESNAAIECFASWGYLHNESVNIFSHLLPSLLALTAEAFLYHYFHARYPRSTYGDQLVFAFFLMTAAVCLGMSATYHTLMNHSQKVSELWLRLDYVGIIILTLGDFVSGIYMVFYCEPTLQKAYWAMILTLGTATIVILVTPRFQGKKYRTFRVGTFICTGLSGFVPLAHGIKLFGIVQMNRQSGMPYYLIEGGLLVLGACFYATRAPESLKPGRFDIWGCSHQIFHILVVLATATHWIGIIKAMDYNYAHRSCKI